MGSSGSSQPIQSQDSSKMLTKLMVLSRTRDTEAFVSTLQLYIKNYKGNIDSIWQMMRKERNFDIAKEIWRNGR